jgi:translation initiation factor IF-1
MVKNSKGGKGAKSMARKNVDNDFNDNNEPIRFAEHFLERYAVVLKMFGNGMCLVNLFNEHGFPHFDILCHIRNKFKGRSKRNHFVSIGSIILVGLREWENPYKNSDLLHVYSSFHALSLSHLQLISTTQHNNTTQLHNDLFLFHSSNNTTTNTTTTTTDNPTLPEDNILHIHDI